MLTHEHDSNFHKQVHTEKAPVLKVSVGLHRVDSPGLGAEQMLSMLSSCIWWQSKTKTKQNKTSLLSSFCWCCCCFLLYFCQPSQSAWPEPGCRRSFSKLSEMCFLVSHLQLRADDKSEVTGTTPNQEPNGHASCFRHHHIPTHFACWVLCSPGYLVLWSKRNTLETPVHFLNVFQSRKNRTEITFALWG